MNNFRLLLQSAFNKLRQHHLIKNFVILIFDRGFQLVSQLFTVFILTNYLGAEKFGVLMYALSLYGFLLTFTNWGLERVLIIEMVGASQKTVSDILLSGFLIKSVLSLGIVLLLKLAYPLIQPYISLEVYNTLQILSFGCFFNMWIVIDAFNQKEGQFKRTAIARIAATITILCVRGIIVLKHLSFSWLIASYIAEQVLCLVIIVLYTRQKNALQFLSFRNFHFHKSLLKSGFFILLSGLCIIAYMRTSQGIVENKFSAAYLGVYSLAISFIEIPISLASILSAILTPTISNYHNRQPSAPRIANGSSIGIFVIVGVLSFGVLMFGGYLLSLFLKPDYQQFYSILVKGASILPLIFLGYSFNMLLITSKQFNLYLVITFVSALVTIGALLFLSKLVSEQSAIYLYIVSQIIASVIVPLILSKELRVSCGYFYKSLVSRRFRSEFALFTNSHRK